MGSKLEVPIAVIEVLTRKPDRWRKGDAIRLAGQTLEERISRAALSPDEPKQAEVMNVRMLLNGLDEAERTGWR